MAVVAVAVVAAVAASCAALSVVAASFLIVRRHLRKTALGSMHHITTESLAYNKDRNGHLLTYDKHSFIINGKRTLLLSGEFHPWRVPDRERWRDVLEMYKISGLNCIRIYIHWGYHSPAEGVYIFDGNRDIDYLLSLCTELRLFVLVAPGPYICAETQAGGHPTWLVAKRDVRIRHSVFTFHRSYDPSYTYHCQSYLNALMPIVARHQITTPGRPGCVIAVQIENENFETFFGWPMGLSDDMRTLSKCVRDCGIDVPLFHNDAWEEGSFIARPSSHTEHGKQTFGLDLYSFDKYVVFAPTSAPLSTISGGEKNTAMWKEWAPANVEKAMGKLESKVRSFGGCAASAPIFIAELQGGWFNHYSLKCTFDTIYNFYGENYTRMILDTVLSQGVTALNYYMFYGGTNWGTVGDTDVYTSYDYSACLREFGFISGRARKLRLGLIFARCFSDIMTKTEPVVSTRITVSVKPDKFFFKQRVSTGARNAELTFLRNFSKTKTDMYTVQLRNRSAITLIGKLPYKQSFIALGNYTATSSGLYLHLSTVPIHARIFTTPADAVAGGGGSAKTEVWIIQCDDEISGEMAFAGGVHVNKASDGFIPSVRHVKQSDVSIVSFSGRSSGWCSISALSENESAGPELILIALTGDDLYTLSATFEEEAWATLYRQTEKGKSKDTVALENRRGAIAASSSASTPVSLSWGAYSINHCPFSGVIHVEWGLTDKRLFVLASDSYLVNCVDDSMTPLKAAMAAATAATELLDDFSGVPNLRVRARPTIAVDSLALTPAPRKALAVFDVTQERVTQFSQLPWIPLEVNKRGRLEKNVIDLGYTSGHAIYRMQFDSPTGGSPTLKIDVRNRATIFLNGAVVGGHTTYSLTALRPGAKNGPDVWPEWMSYHIPLSAMLPAAAGGTVAGDCDGVVQKNELVILVESYGMSRQAFCLNDVRSGRGLLGVKLLNPKGGAIPFSCHVSGVDVREGISQPFGITGFPDEDWNSLYSTKANTPSSASVTSSLDLVKLSPKKGGLPTWFKGTLRIVSPLLLRYKTTARAPLRLCLSGPGTAHVMVGGLYIARYRGNGDSVQRDFIVPESLITASLSLDTTTAIDVEVLVYGGNPEAGEGKSRKVLAESDQLGWVGVQFLGWENGSGDFNGSAGVRERWSGNLHDGGNVFWTIKESLTF